MLIKALRPLKIRLPDGIHALHPGHSYELPDYHALKLLAKAADKVRRAEPTPTPWLDAWEKLAQLTNGIERTDPRFMPVLASLEECDKAFELDNWAQFREAATEVQRLVNAPESEKP